MGTSHRRWSLSVVSALCSCAAALAVAQTKPITLNSEFSQPVCATVAADVKTLSIAWDPVESPASIKLKAGDDASAIVWTRSGYRLRETTVIADITRSRAVSTTSTAATITTEGAGEYCYRVRVEGSYPAVPVDPSTLIYPTGYKIVPPEALTVRSLKPDPRGKPVVVARFAPLTKRKEFLKLDPEDLTIATEVGDPDGPNPGAFEFYDGYALLFNNDARGDGPICFDYPDDVRMCATLDKVRALIRRRR